MILVNARVVALAQEEGVSIDDLIAKYGRRVPRYTSYPTAPHFTPAVTAEIYSGWLADLPADAPLSLYLHVPFCEQLCLFCACHTTVARRAVPKQAYGKLMLSEIALLARGLGRRRKVTNIHWGGGTPTALPASELLAISAALHAHFGVGADAEIAVEIDPRNLPPDRLAALSEMGVTRASLGVQDFDPKVQRAIGRIQPYDVTEACAARLRRIGVRSLNLDLVYGLPHQSADSVAETVRRALALEPDRVAAFGYAHVPWMKRHQRLMPEDALPNAASRFAQREAIDAALLDAGYQPIGLDHFAKPADQLAEAAQRGRVRRNFQGYTTDEAPALLGLGASAIGSLPHGYVQNTPKAPDYAAALRSGILPIARGIALTREDRVRRAIIEALMCRFAVDLPAIAETHGIADPNVLAPERSLQDMASDGLIGWDGARLLVTPLGRPFVRSIAAAFDTYLQLDAIRHAAAV